METNPIVGNLAMRRQLGLFSTPWLMIRWMAGVWFGNPAPLLPGFILKMEASIVWHIISDFVNVLNDPLQV